MGVEAVREVIGELKGQIDDTLFNEGQLFEERLRGLETQQRTMSNAAREACRTLQDLRTMTNNVVSVLDEHVGSHQQQVMKEVQLPPPNGAMPMIPWANCADVTSRSQYSQ